MKDKQEQIEEMAKILKAVCRASIGNSQGVTIKKYPTWEHKAKRLMKKGYRKASDVIDEFVERMKEENETSFRRYGKGIGMHEIFLIADKMKFEIFAETQKENKQ